jgi:hypothetical protein
MQDNKSAAAAISIINLMASPPVCEGRLSCERTGIRPPGSCDPSTFAFNHITKTAAPMPRNRPGPCIKSYQCSAETSLRAVSVALQGAYLQ